jgi:hypothetical protein
MPPITHKYTALYALAGCGIALCFVFTAVFCIYIPYRRRRYCLVPRSFVLSSRFSRTPATLSPLRPLHFGPYTPDVWDKTKACFFRRDEPTRELDTFESVSRPYGERRESSGLLELQVFPQKLKAFAKRNSNPSSIIPAYIPIQKDKYTLPIDIAQLPRAYASTAPARSQDEACAHNNTLALPTDAYRPLSLVSSDSTSVYSRASCIRVERPEGKRPSEPSQTSYDLPVPTIVVATPSGNLNILPSTVETSHGLLTSVKTNVF